MSGEEAGSAGQDLRGPGAAEGKAVSMVGNFCVCVCVGVGTFGFKNAPWTSWWG